MLALIPCQNLSVILFNLLYPVFIVEFYCKGCVILKEYVKTQAIEDRRVFTGSSRNDACALHMTGMRRVRTNGDSCVSRVARRYGLPVRHSRNILFCQIVLFDTHFLYPHYIYHHYPQTLRSASERKP